MLQHTPIERFLERMAASIDGKKNEDVKLTVNLVFSDLKESHVLKPVSYTHLDVYKRQP